jgi:transposase-like protein
MGRPSLYTPELAAAICERLSQGETLVAICRADGMPDPATVWRWREEREDFRNSYARAREAQADVLAEQTISLADEVEGTQDANVVAAARLRVDTRKWFASKMRPRVYGERQTVEHEGQVAVRHFVEVPPDAGSIEQWLSGASASGGPDPAPSTSS